MGQERDPPVGKGRKEKFGFRTGYIEDEIFMVCFAPIVFGAVAGLQRESNIFIDGPFAAGFCEVQNLMAEIPAVVRSDCDGGEVIVSGMYINPQRLEVADMIPYLLVGNQIVVRAGNPKHIDGKASLCGLNVAAPVGTLFEAAAKQTSADCKAAGKPEINLLSLPGTTNCALALTQDRADAIIVSTATVAALMHETPDAYATGGAPFDTDTKVGIAVRKDNPALKAGVEKAVQAIVADGTYAALIKKWNLPPASSAF